MEGCIVVLKKGTREKRHKSMGKETPKTPIDFLILLNVFISLSELRVIRSLFINQMLVKRTSEIISISNYRKIYYSLLEQ